MPLSRELLQERRLFNQFKKAEDLQQLMTWIREGYEEIDDILEDLFLRRFKDTAEGVWLDGVAEIVGITPRPQEEYEPDVMFTYRSEVAGDQQYDTAAEKQGYSSISDTTLGGRYRSIYGNTIADTSMSDENFLVLIEAKCRANRSGGSVPEIYDFIYYGFSVRTNISTATRKGIINIEIRAGERSLSDFERRMIEEYAPLNAGDHIVLTNWT